MVGSVSHFAGRLFTPLTAQALVLLLEDLLTEETADENIIQVLKILFLSIFSGYVNCVNRYRFSKIST